MTPYMICTACRRLSLSLEALTTVQLHLARRFFDEPRAHFFTSASLKPLCELTTDDWDRLITRGATDPESATAAQRRINARSRARQRARARGTDHS